MPKVKKLSENDMADMMGTPRPGEEEVDMHNRMTETFIKDHTIDNSTPTAMEARRKQGPGFYQAIID